MKVILKQDIPHLGKAGEVKEVKKGYGFNFLLPQGLVALATPGALKMIKSIVARAEQERAQTAERQAELLATLDGRSITLSMRSKNGKLFGSVSKAAIVKALDGAIDEAMLKLDQPIKTTGDFEVLVVAGKAQATLKLSVVSE